MANGGATGKASPLAGSVPKSWPDCSHGPRSPRSGAGPDSHKVWSTTSS
jgi:hypothetical protein